MAYDFYWMSGSPNAWRAMLALELKGIPYVSHRLDGSKGEHKTQTFLALNPRGQVPVLTDGPVVVSESIAIMAYVERLQPEPALFGTTPAETGLVWQRIFEFVNHLRDPIDDGVVRPVIRGTAAGTRESVRASAVAVHEGLAWMEGLLAASPFLAGAGLSAADLAALPNVELLARIGARGDVAALEIGFEDLRGRYPAVAAWLRRIEALPAFERAYPPHWRAP